MSNATYCRCVPCKAAGFGLIDALVALTLLAITLLGACGSLHFALRSTQAALWQTRAVDLVADLSEDLLAAEAGAPVAAPLEAWRERVRQSLPAGEVAAFHPRTRRVADLDIHWIELGLNWNGLPGHGTAPLRMALAHAP